MALGSWQVVFMPALQGDARRQGDPGLQFLPPHSLLVESPAGGEAGLEGSAESVGWPMDGVKQG